MGNAFVALADEPLGAFWNPAGIAQIKTFQIQGMYAKWVPGFKMEDAYVASEAVVYQVTKRFTIGQQFTQLQIDGSDRRYTFSESFAISIDEKNLLGATFKYFREEADMSYYSSSLTFESEGMAVDIGLIRKTVDPVEGKPLSLGLSVSNIGPKISTMFTEISDPPTPADLSGERNRYATIYPAEPIPTLFRFGFASEQVNDGTHQFLIAFEIEKELVTRHWDGSSDPLFEALTTSWTDTPFLTDLTYHVGAEYWYKGLLGLRLGYWNDERGQVKPVTVGASVDLHSLYDFTLRFDVSYVSEAEDHPLNGTTRFSLTIDLP